MTVDTVITLKRKVCYNVFGKIQKYEVKNEKNIMCCFDPDDGSYGGVRLDVLLDGI